MDSETERWLEHIPRSLADEFEDLQRQAARKRVPRAPRGELPEWELRDFLRRLGEEMRDARWRAGLTQEQVAAMMDTTKSAVSRLERLGPSVPSVTTLCRYADAIDCRLSIRFVSKRAGAHALVPNEGWGEIRGADRAGR